MPPSDPALLLLQAAARAPRATAASDPAAALLDIAASNGPATQPTPSSSQNFTPAGSFPTGGFLDNMAAGAGKQLSDWGLGIRQLAAKAGATLDPSRFGQAPARLAAQAAEMRQLNAPLNATWGGKIGSAGPAVAAAFIPGLDGVAGMTALGAAQGALTPTTSGQSRLVNTGLGGAFGALGKLGGDALGGWLASRVGAAARPALTDAQQSALSGGASLGMRATPGQQLGSRPLQQLEAKLQSLPATSGPFARVAADNQAALDKAAARSIGENANIVDSTVLGRANERLGDTFENVRNPDHTIMFDPAGTKAALDGIDQDFQGLLPGDMSIRDNKLVAQLDSLAAQGHTTAQQLGQLSSKLGKAAFKEMHGPTGDRDLGQALYQVKDHADDLLESSLSGEEQAEYAAARGQYRNLLLLTSRSGIVNPSTGHVSGVALASKLQQADRTGFTFGNNTSPLYQAARFSQAFKPIVGDSGTATRSGGHAALWSAGLLADALSRGAPLEHAIGEAAMPFALRLGANAGARAYMSPLGQAGLMGLLGGAGALSRGAAAASRFSAPAVRLGLKGAGVSALPLISQ